MKAIMTVLSTVDVARRRAELCTSFADIRHDIIVQCRMGAFMEDLEHARAFITSGPAQ